MWLQKTIQLASKPRGFHLVTSEIVRQLPELSQFNVGLAHIFLQHTSASLSINENADPDVRHDLEQYFSRAVPENEAYFRHTLEGADDMPAHIKTVLIGNSLSLPIQQGKLGLGLWQGIYLCEHRDRASKRSIIITLNGQ